MAIFTLSAFADEYSPNFDRQIEGMKKFDIPNIEVRGVDDINIGSLSFEDAEKARQKLDAAGIGVSSLGSPLGKIKIDEDFEAHKEQCRHVFKLADIFGTENIRIFSFYTPQDALDENRDEVMRRLDWMLNEATKAGKLLLHENEKGIYGESPERCYDIQQQFDGAIKCIFDPANFVQGGHESFPYAFDLLRDYIYYMHIKDAAGDGTIVPAGEGLGGIPQIIAELKQTDLQMYLSFEPHLLVFSGLAGLEEEGDTSKIGFRYKDSDEAFAAATAALRKYL